MPNNVRLGMEIILIRTNTWNALAYIYIYSGVFVIGLLHAQTIRTIYTVKNLSESYENLGRSTKKIFKSRFQCTAASNATEKYSCFKIAEVILSALSWHNSVREALQLQNVPSHVCHQDNITELQTSSSIIIVSNWLQILYSIYQWSNTHTTRLCALS